jgi:hypothetical protein
MAANSGVEKLQGTWEYVDGEHFDDYMKEIVRRFSSLMISICFICNRVLVLLFVNQLNWSNLN